MTVFEAERIIREYWMKSVRSPIGEAALHARLMADLIHGGITEAAATELYARLGFRKRKVIGTDPILTVLARRIDRRPRLGIAPVEPDAETRYRSRGTINNRRLTKTMIEHRSAA